jgi:hypothetical protein
MTTIQAVFFGVMLAWTPSLLCPLFFFGDKELGFKDERLI